jgi:hypothetical protein
MKLWQNDVDVCETCFATLDVLYGLRYKGFFSHHSICGKRLLAYELCPEMMCICEKAIHL